MKCQRCGKNEVAVHYTEVINGVEKQVILCKACATAEGMIQNSGFFSFDIQNFFTPFTRTNVVQAKCDFCNKDLQSIIKTKRAFCPHCYVQHNDYFSKILKSVHGSNEHIGKIPSKAGTAIVLKREYESLRRQLSEAVSNEEYENAAVLRDKIKEMEVKINGTHRS